MADARTQSEKERLRRTRDRLSEFLVAQRGLSQGSLTSWEHGEVIRLTVKDEHTGTVATGFEVRTKPDADGGDWPALNYIVCPASAQPGFQIWGIENGTLVKLGSVESELPLKAELLRSRRTENSPVLDDALALDKISNRRLFSSLSPVDTYGLIGGIVVLCTICITATVKVTKYSMEPTIRSLQSDIEEAGDSIKILLRKLPSQPAAPTPFKGRDSLTARDSSGVK